MNLLDGIASVGSLDSSAGSLPAIMRRETNAEAFFSLHARASFSDASAQSLSRRHFANKMTLDRSVIPAIREQEFAVAWQLALHEIQVGRRSIVVGLVGRAVGRSFVRSFARSLVPHANQHLLIFCSGTRSYVPCRCRWRSALVPSWLENRCTLACDCWGGWRTLP